MSYLGIRRSLGLLAFLLPLVLGPFGFLVLGIEVQENMSSYYHTPLRDFFVGAVSAMGIFLFCYHGYDSLENWTGNLAALSAMETQPALSKSTTSIEMLAANLHGAPNVASLNVIKAENWGLKEFDDSFMVMHLAQAHALCPRDGIHATSSRWCLGSEVLLEGVWYVVVWCGGERHE